MRRARRRTSRFVVALAGLLAACGAPPRPSPRPSPTPRHGGVFRFALTEPRALDPAGYEDAYQWQLMEQIFDGLVDFDADLNVVPSLARTWTVSPDGLTYTFTLREDARFHNGRPVTAEDVRYAYRRVAGVPASVAREYLSHVKGARALFDGEASSLEGIQVTGPHGLTIRLDHPYAPFLASLATPPLRIVPRDEVQSRGAAFGRHPVGSGPFRFVEWRADNVIVLDAHEAYHGGRPYLDRIEVHLGAWEDEVAPFLNGALDRAALGRDDAVRLPPGTPVIQRLELGMTCFGLNVAFRPWGDPRVRRAAALALDRDAVVQATGRLAVASRGVVPDGIPGGGPHAFAPERDLDDARRLLAESGHPGGKGLPPADFWFNSGNPAMKGAAEVVVRSLAEAGIPIRPRPAAWGAFLKVLDAKRAPAYLLTWVADMPDRDSYLGLLFHSRGANNLLNYADADVDRLLERAREEMDPMVRIRLYSEAEARIGTADVLMPLFSVANSVAVRPGLAGMNLDAFGNTDLRRLWWER